MHGIELTPEHPVADLVDLGIRAEAAGFDTVFSSCHYNNRDAFVVLDRVAAATDRVRVGPGVANPYETHPVSLASRLATLAEVTDGRAICGIGAGDRSTLANLGVDRDRPLRRVLETVQVARQLWDGERVDHDGMFVAKDAGLNYPVDDPIPVYVGAQGPDMLRMAAVHADGVLVNAAHPRDVDWATARIAEGLEERERDSAFDIAVYASVSVAADADAARAAARPPVAFIAGGASRRVLDRHGIDRDRAERIGDLIGAGQYRKAFETVTDPMLDAFCVAGTPAAVATRFEAFLDQVDSIVAAAPLGPDLQMAVTLLARALNQATPE